MASHCGRASLFRPVRCHLLSPTRFFRRQLSARTCSFSGPFRPSQRVSLLEAITSLYGSTLDRLEQSRKLEERLARESRFHASIAVDTVLSCERVGHFTGTVWVVYPPNASEEGDTPFLTVVRLRICNQSRLVCFVEPICSPVITKLTDLHDTLPGCKTASEQEASRFSREEEGRIPKPHGPG
ncbi:hypothetical protein CGRA01v4_09097 [Colletotrichum graminicola]|nr:hypothetical protein CGRA01v4_09097 [Colletotrichum graminicola]